MLGKLSLVLLVVVAISTTATFAQENNATVHGTIYDLWTFTPLKNVVIEVYSDSALRIRTISIDGTYSLSLPPGSYTIVGKHYYGSFLISDAQENITLQPNDNITLDLIMFPTFENEVPENEIPENHDNILTEGWGEAETAWWPVLGGVLALALVGVVAFYYLKISPKKPATKKVEAPPVKVVGLPDDLKEVMDVIMESGGRINQVELRKKLPYSEAKVSLMIADLENRGLVRKIKKGRGNIIILKE